MNAEELELSGLRENMYNAWIIEGIRDEIISDKVREWVDKYFSPYINLLDYIKHGPWGHPFYDYEHREDVLNEWMSGLWKYRPTLNYDYQSL